MQKIKFFPVAISFEELAELSGREDFELGDENNCMDGIYNGLEFESLVLQMLNLLPDKHKIIFLYQLLRSTGFNMTHEDLRKSMHLSKDNYNNSLKKVKDLAKKTTQYNSMISQV
jgi:hypothetical protein